MTINYKNLNNLFYVFASTHLIFWTLIPTFTNQNLPLDTIEALAWGSNLDWGFNKHPPMSAFFPEVFFQIFGPNDWAYYLLSQIFVIFSFYYVYKFSCEIFKNKYLGLISVLLIETIYFYNFTSPEFNVNICQLPFWSLTVYYAWKIYSEKNIKFWDCFLIGIFGALGFLSKYLFIYLLVSISFLYIYLILFKKERRFDFLYIVSIDVFLIALIPHLIWLNQNEFITINYGLDRSGLEQSSLIDHIKFPLLFLGKQIVVLVPFFILTWFLVKKFKFKINYKDKKLLFLLSINILPICLVLLTSFLTGSKIRTMWMTPFYLFIGTLVVYLFKAQINLTKFKPFIAGFLFFFFLSPILYAYVSLSKDNKRTDYPGKEIAELVERRWSKKFSNEIMYVIGNEWHAGNLSYHLNTRPKWFGNIEGKINQLDPKGGIIYTGNADVLKQICPGDFGKINKQGFCMIGSK